MLCSICLDNLNPGEQYTLSECGHSFHSNCLITWLRSTNTNSCPLCRSKDNRYSGRRERNEICKKLARRKNCNHMIKRLCNKIKNDSIPIKKKKDLFT